jgi:hypothetical protein
VDELKGGSAVGGGVDGVSGALQATAQEIGDPLFVFHH